MKTPHYFLQTVAAPASGRWREAFPKGRLLDLESLLRILRATPGGASYVWLGSADAAWPDHLQQLRLAQPAARIVLLSNAPQEAQGLAAMDLGARAYTHAHAVPALLHEVALVIEHGGIWVGPELLQRLVRSTSRALSRAPVQAAWDSHDPFKVQPQEELSSCWTLLSPRESEVARAVVKGWSNREVAEALFISERTVKAHLGAIFEKLGVRDRLQLALRLAASVETA